MAKKYKQFQRSDQKTPQTKYRKNFCRQKRIETEQFMQILVYADMKSTKRGIFQQKTPKKNQSWSNQFWIPIANVSVTLQCEKTST